MEGNLSYLPRACGPLEIYLSSDLTSSVLLIEATLSNLVALSVCAFIIAHFWSFVKTFFRFFWCEGWDSNPQLGGTLPAAGMIQPFFLLNYPHISCAFIIAHFRSFVKNFFLRPCPTRTGCILCLPVKEGLVVGGDGIEPSLLRLSVARFAN